MLSSRKALLLIIVLAFLIAFTSYTSYALSIENRRLKFELMQMETFRLSYEQLKKLEKEFEDLYRSYHEVLEANKKLEEALRYLQGKLVLPYNFTLMELEEFAEKYHFAYDEEMIRFVMNATGGWDGSEVDFFSDLYSIYAAWRGTFIYDEKASTPTISLPFINIGGWNYYKTTLGDEYLAEVLFYEDNPKEVNEVSAILEFRQHRGTCGSYAHVLVTLYYVYFDIINRKIPVAYLSVGIEGLAHHACVLLRTEGDKVVIIDWEPITAEANMVKFIPIDDAKQLHSKYWLGRELTYEGVWMRPNINRTFSSYEEFKKWLVEEFNHTS